MEEERSSRTVGFRCAMISMGGDSSGSKTRGEENRFGSSPKKRRRSRR
jgi:sulfatase modifying factor 1